MLDALTLQTCRTDTELLVEKAPYEKAQSWHRCRRIARVSAHIGKSWVLWKAQGLKPIRLGSFTVTGYDLEDGILKVKVAVDYDDKIQHIEIKHELTEVIPGKFFAMLPSITTLTKRPGAKGMLVHLLLKSEGGKLDITGSLRFSDEREFEGIISKGSL